MNRSQCALVGQHARQRMIEYRTRGHISALKVIRDRDPTMVIRGTAGDDSFTRSGCNLAASLTIPLWKIGE
ncbi:MAG: hypothetical protein GY889_13995 [Proteobacteria bacterium]|nr:hypothetical protein [Pseudomonadota bacterium]MDP6950696.1 hypothetical protein [Arenicellales bacterium]HJP07125.1 hypothetical protein [Arenicellales bacterium]